jgi:pimeloyl-ACP methyl ester carboxylesterase
MNVIRKIFATGIILSLISISTFAKPDDEKENGLEPGKPYPLEGADMITFDNVPLFATYYPGAEGKESAIVLLFHGKGGNSGDFSTVIPELTKKGMAVLVPDLRGHGKSTKRFIKNYGGAEAAPKQGNRGPGAFLPAETPEERQQQTPPRGKSIPPITKEVDYKVENFKDEDYRAMADYDLTLLKKFLIFENNQERLNLNKLAIAGIDMGAALAAIWANREWSSGSVRNGRKVKTVILISPAASQMKGIFTNKTLRENVTFMIAVGKNSAESLENAIQIRKEILGDKKEEADTGLLSKCPLILFNTEKQGTALFRMEQPNLTAGIPLFIEDRLSKEDEKAKKWIRIKE